MNIYEFDPDDAKSFGFFKGVCTDLLHRIGDHDLLYGLIIFEGIGRNGRYLVFHAP